MVARQRTIASRWLALLILGLAALVGPLLSAASPSASLHRAVSVAANSATTASSHFYDGGTQHVRQRRAPSNGEANDATEPGRQPNTLDRNVAIAAAPRVAAETESGASSVLRLSPEDSWGNPNALARHFRDHGADFGATSAEDYANQASQFLQRSQREGLPTKIDSDGVIRVYDPETNTFGSFNPDGTAKTFFTPKSGIDYWNRQPGSPPWTGQ